MTLEDLRKAAVEGRPGAREALAHRLRGMIWSRLVKRTGVEAAKDLTQQALLKIFERLDNFEPVHEQAFEHWVKLMVARDLRAYLIKQKKVALELKEAMLVSDTPGPSTEVRARTLMTTLTRVSSQFSTPLRVAAWNLLRGGRSRDLAEEQHISSEAARWRHWRVRQLFMQALATPTPS